MTNLRYLFMILPLFAAMASSAASLEITVADGSKPIFIEPPASTGLTSVVVLQRKDGATLHFSAGFDATVKVSSFGASGAAYGTLVNAIVSNGSATVNATSAGDCGYTFEVAGDRSYHYWIVDYAAHELTLEKIWPDLESDCSTVALNTEGNASAITYYTINGAPVVLSRDLKLAYRTLAFDEDANDYRQTDAVETLKAVNGAIHVPQPLCDTRFALTGDRFTTHWGHPVTVETDTYTATAVDAHCTAENLGEMPDNVSSSAVQNGALGGNAPAEVKFAAKVTDAVRFTEWQMSRTPDFDVIDMRFSDVEFTHTFRDYGNTYVRFMAANESGDCDYVSQTFEVSVGASRLVCPNAFSPGDQNGVNDVWKVSYASLVEFECNIFNRWGTRMARLTEPSQGWDGIYGGKPVPAGVYYYVIRAKGSDGKEYKLSGDINVISYRLKPGYEPAQ